MISFRWILIRLVLVAFLCSVLITEVGAQGVFIDSPDRRDHVYDSTRDILYIATTNRDVERYDVNSGTFLSRFTSPGTRSYNGITISPDDSSIYVADASQGANLGSDQGGFRKFDTTTGAQTNVFYDQAFGEGEAWDIVMTNAGNAIITTEYHGSGWIPMRQLDLATDTFSPSIRRVRQRTHLHASADGSKVLFLESNSSGGPFGIYDVATESFTSGSTGDFNSNILAAVNRDGTQFAIESRSAVNVLDDSLNSVELLFQITGGIGFNPVYDIFYGVDVTTDEVVAYDTNSYQVIERFDIGEDAHGGGIFGDGIMSFSGDGSKLFLSTPTGIRMLNVSSHLRGDVDRDGDVDFDDIGPFIAVLQAGHSQAEADCDGSTVVDFGDIAAFIAILQ